MAAVPATRDGIDPWAQTLPAGWQLYFESLATPTVVDATGKLILPLLASQIVGLLTALDFGGAGVGLANIRRYNNKLDLSRFPYLLVETPAICGEVCAELGLIPTWLSRKYQLRCRIHLSSMLAVASITLTIGPGQSTASPDWHRRFSS